MEKIPDIKKWNPFDSLFDIELVYSSSKHPYNIFVTQDQKTAYISDADFVVSNPIALILNQIPK